MTTYRTIPELFDDYAQLESDTERVQFLQHNSTEAVKTMLRFSFSEKIKSGIEMIPEFRKDDAPEGMFLASLWTEYRRLYLFEDKEVARIGLARANVILTQILEAIDPKEGELLIATITKTLHTHVPGLTKSVVDSAYPGLLNT